MDRFENSMYEAIFRSPNQNEETELREWDEREKMPALGQSFPFLCNQIKNWKN